MKKLLLFILPVMAGFLFSACGTGTEQDVSNLNTVTDVVTAGKWKVEIYVDDNQDQTNDFAGYSFTFSRNGALTATAGNITTSGNWVEDQAACKLNISFPAGNPLLERITNVWNVTEVNFTMINLSNNNPQNEYLGIVPQ